MVTTPEGVSEKLSVDHMASAQDTPHHTGLYLRTPELPDISDGIRFGRAVVLPSQ